jgi:hypothetical protein
MTGPRIDPGGNIDLGAPPQATPQIPGSPQTPSTIEHYLGLGANEAITQGAPVNAVNARLGQVLTFLKANPQHAQDANTALAAGADPGLVVERTHALANGTYKPLTSAAQPSASAAVTPPVVGSNTQKYDGSNARVGMGDVLAHGATSEFSDEMNAAADALVDAAKAKFLHGGDFGSTLRKSYDQNVAAERAALKEYSDAHPIASGVGEVTGAVGGALAGGALLGAGARAVGIGAKAAEAVNAASNASRGARILRAAGTGAAIGAASGAGNAEGGIEDRAKGAGIGAAEGAVGGAIAQPAGELVSKGVARLGGTRLTQAAADALADKLPQGSKAAGKLRDVANALGARGAANTEIAQRAAEDQAAGFTPSDGPKGVELSVLERGGPSVTGLAENIANRPGPGRAIITKAANDRQGQMRDAVTKAFDQGTGTTREDGEALLRRLSDEQASRANVANVAKTVTAETNAAEPDVPKHLDAWQSVTGGNDNAIGTLRQYVDDRSKEAADLYGKARAATQGQAVRSETLDDILKTPAGQQAFSWAKAQKGNRMSPLPTTGGAPAGYSPEQWANVQMTAAERGISMPDIAGDKELPDPEVLHLMKQKLAQTARLGIHDGAGGTVATQAQGALNIWGKVRSELPDVWRSADDAYSARSRVIDALNKGRDVMRAQTNPAGKKAIYQSLDAIERDVGAAPAIEQQAYRTGALSAVTDKLRNGPGFSAKQVAALGDPKSAMARRIALATGDAATPAKLADALAAVPHQIPAAPPIPEESATSAAARTGLDITKYRAAPSGNSPEKSLAQLAVDKSAMSPDEQKALQQGAAQAVRGKLDAANMRLRSPGQVVAKSPERLAQVAHAFPDATSHQEFQNTVRGWDDLQGKIDRILGGSQTARRVAEDASRDKATGSAAMQLVGGNVGGAAKTLLGGAAKESANKARAMTDAEIARILTSTDATSVQKAQAASVVHGEMRKLLDRFSTAAGARGAGALAKPMQKRLGSGQ